MNRIETKILNCSAVSEAEKAMVFAARLTQRGHLIHNMKDLIRLMDPKYIEVWGKFTPRGGISIDPYCNYGKAGTCWEKVAFERLTHHDLYPEKVDNR